jgi:hypothetical protein
MDTDAAPPCCTAEHCTRELRDHEAGQWICTPCIRTIRAWLTELPTQMIVLRGSMQRETIGSPVRSGTRTPPLPGRLDTLNLIGPSAPGDVTDPHGDQHGPLPVTAVLGAWVRIICEERRLDPPLPATEEALAHWLDQRLSWAARQPWCGELRGELWDMIRAVRGITRARPARRPVRRPCPRCLSLELTETDHQPYIECGQCEALWTQAELEADAEQRAAEVREEESAAA